MDKIVNNIIAAKIADAIEANCPELADAARGVSLFSHRYKNPDTLVASFWRAYVECRGEHFAVAVAKHVDDGAPLPEMRGWTREEFEAARQFALDGLKRELKRTCGHTKRSHIKRLIGYLEEAQL